MQERIMQYNKSKLIAPDGTILWTVDYKDRLAVLKDTSADFGNSYDTLLKMCGSPIRSNGDSWINSTALKQKAEELSFVSHKGCASGFFVRLPAATYIDKVVCSFNEEYFKKTSAVDIDFPTIFDARTADTKDLTESYEEQGLMFRLDERDEGLRLSYAADPGLFSWLRNTKLITNRLPYTIVSHTNMMRRHPSGKLGPLGRSREYKLPDMHRFVPKDQAEESMLDIIKLNSESLRYWVNENYAQFADVTEDFLEQHPQLPTEMAKAANRFTLINTFKHQPRYYTMRNGMMADGGTGAIMLYNIQWDEENSLRYNIKQENGNSPVIIHFNALTGSGLMNTVLGRSMAGIVPKAIPAEFNPTPVVLIPVHEKFVESAHEHAARFNNEGINSSVEICKKSLGNAIWTLRNRWQTAYAVIGENEAGLSSLILSQGQEAFKITEREFIDNYKIRSERCGHGYLSPHLNLPFLAQGR